MKMCLFKIPYDSTQVTVELRELVENGVDVWAFEYPSYYKGNEKTAFEKKVLAHYWFRQIGQETPGRWLHYFRARINEIMPYYIQLYESQALMKEIEDPFANVDIVETYDEERTGKTTGKLSSETSGTSSSENTGESSGTDTENRGRSEEHIRKFSNTPQGSVYNLDNYMTEANVETAEDSDTVQSTHAAQTSATSNGTASGTQEDSTEGTEESTTRHTFTKKGNQGVNTYAHDMNEFRTSIIDAVYQIINDKRVAELFLTVY